MTIDPAALAAHYSRFRVGERILLTGHAHQAWPDVGFDAQARAWTDAAEFVDGKWTQAEEQAGRVRDGFARLLGDRAANIALGQNVHELLVRLLSALPLQTRRRLVTTDAEFSSVRRQLARLAEEGIEVVQVAARPVETASERLAAAVDDRTACVFASSVFYATAEILPGLDLVAGASLKVGAALLVDAYHHLNVVPFDIHATGLESAFVTGGGYKYCQLGEGNAFLRVPEDCRLRPVITGWFAEPPAAAGPAPHPERGDTRARDAEPVGYGDGAAAFAGATYDPASHYRAAAVFAFHRQHGLTPPRLRDISRHQVTLAVEAFAELDLDPAVASIDAIPGERRAGFLAIRTPHAAAVAAAVRADGLFVDARGGALRVGPAPYVRDDQLTAGIEALGVALRRVPRAPMQSD